MNSFSHKVDIEEKNYFSSFLMLNATIVVGPSKVGKHKVPSQGGYEPNVPKGKRKDKFLPILDLEYFWVLKEVASYLFEFTFKELVEELVSYFTISSDNLSKFIVAEACTGEDKVYRKPTMNDDDFIFVYEFFFKELDMFLCDEGPIEHGSFNVSNS